MLADYKSEIAEAVKERRGAEASLDELRPYLHKLSDAAALGLGSDTVEQSGFQELMALDHGEPLTGSCPICYETVGSHGAVVVTSCARTSSASRASSRG